MNNTDPTKTTTQKTKKMNNTDPTKTTTQKTKKMNNMDPTKNLGLTQMFPKGKQFLPLIRHQSCLD
jgi:hypothetical protein